MANSFGLNEEQERVLAEILNADGADFSRLVEVAGLDPSEDFRGADLRGVDFGRSDLEGYDFSDADLSGCRFDRARLGGAVFANNRTDGTVWPRPPSKRRSSRVVLHPTVDYALHPFQHEAIGSILSALEEGVVQPVVLMPPGTGRTKLLEALLTELDKRDMLGTAMIYSSSQAGTEQLRQRLSHDFGSDAVSGLSGKGSSDGTDARLIVAPISSLRAGSSRYALFRTIADVTHVVVFDGALTSARLDVLRSEYPGAHILRFAEISSPRNRLPQSGGDGQVVFELSYGEAMSAGMLERAEINGYRFLDSIEHADEEGMQLTVSEVLEVANSMPSDTVGGIVCRNTESVRRLARELQRHLDYRGGRQPGVQRIVQHTSPTADESLVKAALDLRGTLLLMNEVVASDFDWSVLDYAVVLTRLRSPERLAFVRRRQGRTRRLQVIDFMHNFDDRGAWDW
jgi:hypothetical protein